MNSIDRIVDTTSGDVDFNDSESAWESSVLSRMCEPARFLNEYRSFDFEAMSEIPDALDAFIDHQHNFDL